MEETAATTMSAEALLWTLPTAQAARLAVIDAIVSVTRRAVAKAHMPSFDGQQNVQFTFSFPPSLPGWNRHFCCQALVPKVNIVTVSSLHGV